MAPWRRAPPLRAGWRGLLGGRRHAVTLPQIPGAIFANKEIPEDRLVRQIRRWAKSSPSLSAGKFDLLQIAEQQDGRLEPRALCGFLRGEVLLAGSSEPLRSFVALFYRSRDMLNSEFWEDQARRLCDILADEYLGNGRGLQLLVHHNCPEWAMGLEMGDHRLLAEFQALHVVGQPFLKVDESAVEFLGSAGGEAGAPQDFHRLMLPDQDGADEAAEGELRRGHYVLRQGGRPVCGLEVLGVPQSRLLCGAPWAEEGQEASLAPLLTLLLRRARKPVCSLFADGRDPRFQRLRSASLGLMQTVRPMRVAVTGSPSQLRPEEQASLASAPFLVPWEFVPFHAGQFVLI